jgi:hypothetical protein
MSIFVFFIFIIIFPSLFRIADTDLNLHLPNIERTAEMNTIKHKSWKNLLTRV